jgi:mono/diheme cytochrome c family protein
MAARGLTLAIAAALLLAPGVALAQSGGDAGGPATSIGAEGVAGDQLARGKSLVAAGDCISCHTRSGGAPFSGGRAIKTPYGIIFSPNITPDKDTGIGAWTSQDFYRAVHQGIAADGTHLYPAFPYPAFTRITPEDVEAMRVYLATLPAVAYTPPPNQLHWPFSMRFLMIFWNALFFKEGIYQAEPDQSAEWNRGAYLVEGLGHCGACHTPRNLAGGIKRSERLIGTRLDDLDGNMVVPWLAADLRPEGNGGIGDWSADEIALFLNTGATQAHGAVAGPMTEVIENSTSQMSDSDIHAIAVYLKSLPPSGHAAATPAAIPADRMAAGQAIYTDNCATCHQADGSGKPNVFPPLKGSAVLTAPDPATAVQIILRGSNEPQIGGSSVFGMPTYGTKLSDEQIAQLLDYLRNSWGNAGAPVSAGTVHDLRGSPQ